MTANPPPLAIVDTDILSEILKQRNAEVVERAANYLDAYGQFAFSAITFYEVTRGLKAKKADKQLAKFKTFCAHSTIYDVTQPILERASELWVSGRNGGHPHHDADLIIAATALVEGRTLVTGNSAHFAWIEGLTVDDWR